MSFLKRLLCLVFGHGYYVHQHFSSHSRRVRCNHCDGDWAMNDDAHAFLPWDKDFEDLYRTHGKEIRQ